MNFEDEPEEQEESYVPDDDNWEFPLLKDVVATKEFKQTLEDIVSGIERPQLFEYLGIKPRKSFLFFGDVGCLLPSTKILTPYGEKNIKDVRFVWSVNKNKELEVKPALPVPTRKKLVEVEFDDGSIVGCSEDHPFFVSQKKVKMLKELKEGDFVVVQTQRPTRRKEPFVDKLARIKDNLRVSFRRKRGKTSEEIRRFAISDRKKIGKKRNKKKNKRGTIVNNNETRMVQRTASKTNVWKRKQPIQGWKDGWTKGEQTKVYFNSEGDKGLGVLLLWSEEDKRYFRLGGSSQRWKSFEQRCRKFSGSMSKLSLKGSFGKRRIVAIRKTKRTVEMFDLIVPDNNNFLLSNGVLTHNTGKTFSVKAIRNELAFRGVDVAWMPYDIGTYGTAYINMGAVNLTKYFKNGKKAAARGHTVLYFMDEAEVLLRNRGEDNARHKEDDKVTDAMLKQLGALNEHGSNRFVFLATNYLGMIDAAVRRAGRVDQYLEFPNPSPEALYKAYRAKMSGANDRGSVPLFKNINGRRLVELSEGFNYADVDEVVNRCVGRYAFEMLRRKASVEELKPFTQKYVEGVIVEYRAERGKKDLTEKTRPVGYMRW